MGQIDRSLPSEFGQAARGTPEIEKFVKGILTDPLSQEFFVTYGISDSEISSARKVPIDAVPEPLSAPSGPVPAPPPLQRGPPEPGLPGSDRNAGLQTTTGRRR